ncbi:hypothetical protein WICMUC_002401 [Wickerhamomyces mucosus]|uniref:DUF676 domain-containing protein n=1 Tax=Wickerhamomyces mucosus TaxID=1378264 RepID=A0A9P8PRD7_9ASCO|nr:hypothetical protein WICMUC_002401 [Wickerhamomyces mucosus]
MKSLKTIRKLSIPSPSTDSPYEISTPKTPSTLLSNFNNLHINEHNHNSILYRKIGALALGEVHRFHVEYFADDNMQLEEDSDGKYIWIRVQNEELNLFRPIYLTGPFSFYIHVIPHNYDTQMEFDEDIQFNTDIKPAQSFKAKLRLNKNSQMIKNNRYSWTIDIVSQIALTTSFKVNYELSIGIDYNSLKDKKSINNIINNESNQIDDEFFQLDDSIKVKFLDTNKLWGNPPKRPKDDVHLVVLTHGIFSNTSADMLYLKDQIEKTIEQNGNDANIIVRGFNGNIGKSEKGIKYLGKRVGDYILNLVNDSDYKITHISFVGHSLGGPVQAYAIYYIATNHPEFFNKIIPINYIMLASPILGVLTEFAKTVSLALDIGFLGITGRDLTLRHKLPSLKSKSYADNSLRMFTTKPILEQIIRNPLAHSVFQKFVNRTTYANTVHDGIVPLRAAAMLYLDWESLDEVKKYSDNKEISNNNNKNDNQDHHYSEDRPQSVNEIPDDLNINNKGPFNKVRFGKQVSKSNESPEPESPSSQSFPAQLLTNKPTSFLKKNKKQKKIKKYLRTQTKNGSSSSSDLTTSTQDYNFNIPPTASTFLTAANVLISPEPSLEFLKSPNSRPKTIFHDSIYKFEDLPPPHYSQNLNPLKSHNKNLKTLFGGNSRLAIQERIARLWHFQMEWRKVLVVLNPDAHNNIVVRRTFTNAWGWEVIDHLVNNHFSKDALDKALNVKA